MADALLSNVTAELPLKTVDAHLILYIVFVIVIAYVITYLLSFILFHVSERIGWYRTSVTMTIPLLKLIVYTVALYYIITALIEPSLTQMIAFSGLFGAAIGFGLKDLFSDIVGGIVIIFEKPYQIGDKVTIGDKYGEVTDIGIRSTRIRTPADETVSLPNFSIFTQPVTSGNAGDLAMMVTIDLFIHPESDADAALKILKEALVTSKYVIISKKYPFAVWISKTPFSLHSLHRNRPSPSAQESSAGIGREQESQRFACSTPVLQNNAPGMEFISNFSPGKRSSLQQYHRFSCSKQ